MCLNIKGASTTRGARIIQWPCSTRTTNDLWLVSVDGGWKFQAYSDGLCLNVKGLSHRNGAPLIQWNCAVVGNERFVSN